MRPVHVQPHITLNSHIQLVVCQILTVLDPQKVLALPQHETFMDAKDLHRYAESTLHAYRQI